MNKVGINLFSAVIQGAQSGPTSRDAVVATRQKLSWDELLSGALGIASQLMAAGVLPKDRVALWMEKSPTAIQGLLGILAVGGAYVAIDPKSPPKRCARIIADSGAVAILADAPRARHLAAVLSGTPCRMVLLEGNALVDPVVEVVPIHQAVKTPHRPLPSLNPDGLAYILYTSGSTGTPKGVAHTHASGLAFVQWVQRTFGTTQKDFFSSHAPLHFDLSISDVFAALASGGKVRLFNSVEAMSAPWLARTVRGEGITLWYSVPSVLVAMMEQGDLQWPNVRTVLFAGEVFPTPQLKRLRSALPQVDLCNLYGPTETNVCTFYRVPKEMDESNAPISIGAACDHMHTVVLDDSLNEVPPGEEGTLWASGGNLMVGYFGDPERTAASLRQLPGRRSPFYCTGDRVRLRPDGNYEFLGRRDHQLKRRGFRIELGEIEAAAAAHPAILEVVAWSIPHEPGGCRIGITAVARKGASLDEGELLGFLAKWLPVSMMPDLAEVRAELPRTSTGKVDRRVLTEQWALGG